MAIDSPFTSSDYTADRNIRGHYYDQMATLLAIKRDEDPEEIRAKLETNIVPNQNGYKDRRMQVLVKNKYGDREVAVMPAGQFFGQVQKENYHLSPSMVAYKNSDEEQSVNSIGTEFGLKQRSLYKNKRQEAIAAGDSWGEKTFDAIQNALKIFNNAQSGAMSSNGTPLVNKSGHTSLTSTCRALTSTANICNERFLAGNRLYNSYQRTLENILSTIVYTDLELMESVIKKHNMNYATVDQVINMIDHCTNRYWRNKARFNDIVDVVKRLRPVELTAVLCLMDLEGLRVSNRDLLEEFLTDFSIIPEIPENAPESEFVKPDNGDRYVLCISKLPDEAPQKEDVEGNKAYQRKIWHLNAYHLKVEEKWKDFIQVFFKSDIPPSGVYDIRDMIREVVQTSDTDSSIYTVDTVVDEFSKDKGQSLRLNGVLTYFIRMIAVHQHAQLSENMNVSKKYLYRLTMKNEYLFGSYVTTTMSKHYFATQVMVEGVMQKKIKMEIKGVHLRSSKIAAEIKEFAHGLMREILDCIHDKRLLDAADILQRAGDLERQIIEDIEVNGDWRWLTRQTIKDGEVYTTPESSVYQYHILWNEVFAEKYGEAPPPPYAAIKVNALTLNKTAIEEWGNRVQDKSIVEKLHKFLKSQGEVKGKDQNKITTFYIPDEILPRIKKMPIEIIQAADIRSIIKQNLKSVYAVLESVGLFICNESITRLVSDEH